MGKVVRVKKLPARESKPTDADELLEKLCYYYPQYTFAQARKLPYKRVVRLLRMARKCQAEEYYNLTQIAAAPHTEKGKGVSELISHYKDAMRHG